MNVDFNRLRKRGFVQIDNFVDVASYMQEFDAAIKASKVDYPAGGMARIPREDFGRIPTISKIFMTNEFKKLASDYLGTPLNFMLQIFISHEWKPLPKEQWSRNQHLHFDPFHALKFMLYFTDVGQENGAFTYIPETMSIGKELRGRNSLDKNLRTNTYTLEAHPDFAYLRDQAIPIEGKAGTLLIFDTDMIHGGGIVKSGERKVVIVHNRL